MQNFAQKQNSHFDGEGNCQNYRHKINNIKLTNNTDSLDIDTSLSIKNNNLIKNNLDNFLNNLPFDQETNETIKLFSEGTNSEIDLDKLEYLISTLFKAKYTAEKELLKESGNRWIMGSGY